MTMLKKLYLSLCVASLLSLTSYATILARPYKHLGCYGDRNSPNRALPEDLGYFFGSTPVKDCAVAANERGYSTFALHFGYECHSGPTADQTYNKYGKSDDCWGGGKGGTWTNDVYQFTDEIIWPRGTYSLLKPTAGCPPEWNGNGWVLQDTLDNVVNKRSLMLHIDGYVTRNYVVRSFCTKTKITSPEWPEGQYCIYKEGTTKPTPNMKTGWIRMDNEKTSNKDAVKFRKGIIVTTYSIRLYFYCKTTGKKSVPIALPASQPFYLLPYGSPDCQQVKWMVATREWIQYSTRNYQRQTSWRSSIRPYIIPGTRSKLGVTMYYCYYESCNITLSERKGVFQSPGFPGKYPDGQLCSWTLRVPANHSVLVHFTHFSLNVESGNDTDVMEFYRPINDSFLLSESYHGYHGDRQPFTVTSSSDLMFVFRSNEANNSFGFSAEYSIFIPQESTTGSPIITDAIPTTRQQPTDHPSTDQPSTDHPSTAKGQSKEQMNKTSHDSFKDNRGGSGTVILIVIPLVCFILVVVVIVDIYYRCRSKSCLKTTKEDPRTDSDEKIAVNPTYGNRSEIMPMTNFNSTTTVNTIVDTADGCNEGYGRLSRILPRHEIPEQYQELNRSVHPNGTNEYQQVHPRVSQQDNAPNNLYQVLEGPDADPVPDDQMYQTIDRESCPDGLYERNILYGSVA